MPDPKAGAAGRKKDEARYADLLRSGTEDEIEEVELPADPPFQRAAATYRQLARQTSATLAPTIHALGETDRLPTVICAWGKCRVGSTALTNLFGIADIPAYYQPVKSVLRAHLTGANANPWQLDEREGGVVFCKEMAGPYTLAEIFFNPIRILRQAGYPTEKLKLVQLDRDPYASMTSWLAKWGDRIGEQKVTKNFVLSSLAYHRMRRYAKGEGVGTTSFVYEAIQRPKDAIERLFVALGIEDHFDPRLVADWGEAGDLGSARSKIIYPIEPKVFSTPNLHSAYNDYAYRQRTTASLSDHQRAEIAAFRLDECYEASVTHCVADLGLEDDLASLVRIASEGQGPGATDTSQRI